MFSFEIKRDKFTVKPFYTNYCYHKHSPNKVTDEEFRKAINDCYAMLLKVDSKAGKEYTIEEDATLDEVLLFLQKTLYDGYNIDSFFTNKILFGVCVESNYETGFLPLKAFYKERKDKKFFKFLLEILGNLKSLDIPIMNNYLTEIVGENIRSIYEDNLSWNENPDDYVPTDEYYATKEWEKLIVPMLNIIPSYRIEHSLYIIKKWCRKYPYWKAFILDVQELMKHNARHSDITSFGYDDDFNDNETVDFADSHCFIWEDFDSSAFDYHFSLDLQSYFDNGYNINYVVPTNPSMTLKEMNYSIFKANLIIKLFTKRYDCFW